MTDSGPITGTVPFRTYRAPALTVAEVAMPMAVCHHGCDRSTVNAVRNQVHSFSPGRAALGGVRMNQSLFDIILARARRVIQLDTPVFGTIARDPNATQQAAIVVGAVAVAGAIGGANEGAGGMFVGLVGALFGWLIFSGMAWFFGTNIFGTPTTVTNWEALLRTLGYAQAPRILALFGFIPVLGGLISFIGAIWAIITGVIAIRETLGFSTGRAIITGLIAAIGTGLVAVILGLLFGVAIYF